FHSAFGEVAENADGSHYDRERDRKSIRNFGKKGERTQRRKTRGRDEPADQTFDRFTGRYRGCEFVLAERAAGKICSGVRTEDHDQKEQEQVGRKSRNVFKTDARGDEKSAQKGDVHHAQKRYADAREHL